MTVWTEFLANQGATLEGDIVANFGAAAEELLAARDGAILADLAHYGLIAFSGEDAVTFLHALISNDLRKLNEKAAVFAAHLSPKGRMLANFLVLKRSDDLLVLLPAALRESIQKRLSMYILRTKVKARDASGEWVRLGLSGPGSDAAVADLLGQAVAAEILAMGHADDLFAIRLGEQRFDLFIAPTAAPAIWSRLRASHRPVGAAAWDWLLVDAGIPTVLPATQDLFVPQMANMEVLGGVCFTKGCYPGQEIVARSQYLGKVKRRLYLAHVESEASPGEELFSADLPDQAAGHIANVAPAPGGGHDVLAVVHSSSEEAGDVRLRRRDGPRLAFRPLPYAL